MWQNWKQVRVLEVESPQTENVSVGSQIPVKARVQLGNILPSEVSVQLYRGQLDVNRLIQEGTEVNMQLMGTLPKGIYAFQGEIPCEQSGLCGFTVRVVPFHPDAIIPYELPLITWEA
jgi:starch phosphorylase